jgi:SCY1-like protein 1
VSIWATLSSPVTDYSRLPGAFESAPAMSAQEDAASAVWGIKLQSPTHSVASENPWKDASTDDLASAFKASNYPSLSTQSTLQPKPPSATSQITSNNSAVSTPSVGMSTVPSTWQSPVTSPKLSDDWGGFGGNDMVAVDEKSTKGEASAAVSMAGMSKEEKAAEMARRREERKARIAQLKEQRKGGA